MKSLALLITLALCSFAPPLSIYDLKVQSVNGGLLSLSSFKGRKIAIAPFDAKDPDIRRLKYLDSVQRNNDMIKVIAVPMEDFTGPVTPKKLADLKTNLHLSYPITKPALLKKIAGERQDPLFRWLTRASENTHFDLEVEEPGQLYVISETGMLYAVIGKKTSEEIVSQVLNQKVAP